MEVYRILYIWFYINFRHKPYTYTAWHIKIIDVKTLLKHGHCQQEIKVFFFNLVKIAELHTIWTIKNILGRLNSQKKYT